MLDSSHLLGEAALNLGSLAVVVTFAWFAIQRREWWELRVYSLGVEATAASAGALARALEEKKASPEVLACAQCGAPLPLAESPTTSCPHCRAVVPIPPEYLELVRTRAAARAALATEISELKRTELATHPAWAALWLLSAFGLGALLVRLNDLSGAAPVDAWLSFFAAQFLALLIVPVGMVISAAGQLGAWSEVSDVVSAFTAKRDPGKQAWTCRQCAAPLPAANELGEICSYCGAENLFRAGLADQARTEETVRHALGVNIERARAIRWSWFWTGIQVPSFLLALIGGLIFLSMGAVSLIAGLGG